MSFRHLLIPVIFLLTICNVPGYSQNNNFKAIFSSDSLSGFDEQRHQQAALSEGLFGSAYKSYMENQKRAFIMLKYNLVEQESVAGSLIPPGFGLKQIGGGNMINAAPCVNEGFEANNFNGWTAMRGRNNSSQVYPTFTANVVAGPQLSIVATPFVDPYVGSIPNSPLGGSLVARINNNVIGDAKVIRLQQTFSVTMTNYLYDFAYWAVMENAASHNCTETPYMAVRIRNFTGTLQSCPNFSIVAPSSGFGGCAGIGPLSWVPVIAGGTTVQTSNGWQKFSIDLTPYMAQNVTVEVLVAHCSLTGHFGYSYFDSNCNTMNLTVNNATVISMPTASVYPQVPCGTTATLTAPSGLNPYAWFGPPGSGISNNSNSTIATSVPGNYTLNMSPTGICNPPMQKIISLSFVPPTTVAASPGTICAAGTATNSTLTASGASNYTWSTGQVGASIVVSPTSTTVYTVTAQTGTCIGTFTTEVVVTPNPNVSVVATSTGVCSGGQSATLTANGASSYVWNPGNLSGSSVTVAPASNTTYTVVGTTTAGCQGTASVQIQVNSTPTLLVAKFPATGSVCIGDPVTLFATGAIGSNYTWTPSNQIGGIVIVTPSVTTVYTVVGAAGSCTSSATVTVFVDPGPSMTITATPTISCPGATTSLNALAPTAVGFTWNPGNSN